MTLRLIGSLILACALTACGGPTAGTAPGTVTGLTGQKQGAEQPRVLASGVFTLPQTLVSVGSGSLVSVGSGQIVSTGSAMFRVQGLAMVAVADAVVAMKRPRGQSAGVNAVVTDAAGRYRLMGLAASGAYRVEATHAGHRYMSLVNVSSFGAADAPIDVATTMVAERLIATSGAIEVLAAGDFQSAVEAVRGAIDAQGLPADFTPGKAAEALATLEAASPELSAALGELTSAQAEVDQRVTALDYRLQSLADELGVAPATLENEARALLAKDPTASVTAVTEQVRTRRTTGEAAAPAQPAATPAAPATPAATPAPTATPSTAPVTPQPTATPTPAPTPASSGKGNGKGNNGNGNNGNGNGNGHYSEPTPKPSPTATPTAVPTASSTTLPDPEETPTAPQEEADEAPNGGNQAANGNNGQGNGNAGNADKSNNGNNGKGKGNAYGHDKQQD